MNELDVVRNETYQHVSHSIELLVVGTFVGCQNMLNGMHFRHLLLFRVGLLSEKKLIDLHRYSGIFHAF